VEFEDGGFMPSSFSLGRTLLNTYESRDVIGYSGGNSVT